MKTVNTELNEYFVGNKTTLTIENVSVPTLMTSDEYHDYLKNKMEKEDYPLAFFAPKEITDNYDRKLELFCLSDEEGSVVQYYKMKL